jgi:uncharacterized membrane protein YdbT with pleckstrin-like domain
MGYTESLLSDGEKIALRERQHWLAPTVHGRRPLLLIVAGIVVFVLSLNVTGGLNTLLVYAALVLLVVGLVWFGSYIARWRAEAYLVTNRRVIKVTGVLNKHAADSSLEMINDAVLDQSVLGRILGYGDLGILTGAKVDGDKAAATPTGNRAGAEGEIDHFRMLHHAVAFKIAMLNEKQQLEFEGMRPVAFPGGR